VNCEEEKRPRSLGYSNPDPRRTLQCSRYRRVDGYARRSTAPAKTCKEISGGHEDHVLLLQNGIHPHRLKLFSVELSRARAHLEAARLSDRLQGLSFAIRLFLVTV